MSNNAVLSNLRGRTAIVTGSTSGIGLGIARRLAAQGADLVINGLGGVEAIEPNEAMSITGAVIPVDGGWTAH